VTYIFREISARAKVLIQSYPGDNRWSMPAQTMTSTTKAEQLGIVFSGLNANAVAVSAFDATGDDVFNVNVGAFKLLVFC
jgi:hypothetical protein